MKTLTYAPLTPAPLPASANPFAHNPALDELRSELDVNVGREERVASGVAGLLLLAANHYMSHSGGWLRGLAGAILVSRAVTGHCPLYYALGRDTRHYAKSES
jgi:hypothetical protein